MSSSTQSSKPASITSLISSTRSKSSATSYVRTGIGGVGNYRKNSSDNSLDAALAQHATPPVTLPASSGIGGYGNHRNVLLTTAVPFDDAKELITRSAKAPAYRGIGGAGNRNVERSPKASISGADRMKARLSSVFA